MSDVHMDNIGAALGRIPSGLFIVTACYEDRREGMLASWLQQASFEPPMVTLALKKNRGLRLLIESAEHFAVTILGQDDGDLMKPFFKPPGPDEDSFAGLNIEECEFAAGAPVLLDAHAWLACELVESLTAGDNVLYLAEVVGGKQLKKDTPKTHVRTSGFKY